MAWIVKEVSMQDLTGLRVAVWEKPVRFGPIKKPIPSLSEWAGCSNLVKVPGEVGSRTPSQQSLTFARFEPNYAAFKTLPCRMQDAQTRIRLIVPLIWTRISCRLGSQRRLVLLCAWLMLLPLIGFFPHTSQTLAMIILFQM